jgi:hypothetical protein
MRISSQEMYRPLVKAKCAPLPGIDALAPYQRRIILASSGSLFVGRQSEASTIRQAGITYRRTSELFSILPALLYAQRAGSTASLFSAPLRDLAAVTNFCFAPEADVKPPAHSNQSIWIAYLRQSRVAALPGVQWRCSSLRMRPTTRRRRLF